jgi:16S rRNA (adenine1518-N6/adenine1519-N6)-dimethyltransferase
LSVWVRGGFAAIDNGRLATDNPQMKDAVRQTRTHLLELFEQHGFHPRTDLGQNFLIDLNLVEYIARQAELKRRDVVLEIGCGTGGLTTFLARKAGHVISVDVDDKMIALARSVTADYDNVTLLHSDALKNKNRFSKELVSVLEGKLNGHPDSGSQLSALNVQPSLKLVSNLPYSIATPVVSNLVASELPWERMVVTIQWELALRMAAEPQTSQFGALSVWLQSQCFVKILKKIPPNVFWPRPQVDSAIVLIRPNPAGKAQIADRPFFQDFVRRLFHQRRKLARSVLCGMYRKQLPKTEIDAILTELGYDAGLRAEQMPVPDLVRLANRVREAVPAEADRRMKAEKSRTEADR